MLKILNKRNTVTKRKKPIKRAEINNSGNFVLSWEGEAGRIVMSPDRVCDTLNKNQNTQMMVQHLRNMGIIRH